MDHRRVAIFIDGRPAATNGPRQPSHRRLNPQHQAATDEREAPCRVPSPRGPPRRVREHPGYANAGGIVNADPELDTRSLSPSNRRRIGDGHARSVALPDERRVGSPGWVASRTGLQRGWHRVPAPPVRRREARAAGVAGDTRRRVLAREPRRRHRWGRLHRVQDRRPTGARSAPSMSAARPCPDGRSGLRGIHGAWKSDETAPSTSER